MFNTQTGKQGFLWFFGKVIDVNDPLRLGRVKVFIFHDHSDALDSQDFRWAIPILPVTSPSAVFGTTAAGSTMNLIKDSMVFGFFADGTERQQPMILGSFHTAPNYPSLGGISIPQQAYGAKAKPPITPNDPPDTANPQYPLNSVYTSPAGHTIELDNTPGSNRVAVHHSSGSYVEIDNDGHIVIGSTNAASFSSRSQTDITANGNVNIASQRGNVQIEAAQVIKIESGREIRIITPSSIRLQAGAGVTVKGNLVVEGSLTVQDAVSGTFTSPTGQVAYVSGGMIVGLG